MLLAVIWNSISVPGHARERVVYFPAKTAIGKLYSLPINESLIGTVDDRYLAEARGRVNIPDGLPVLLKGGFVLSHDLSPFLKLKADDIDYLNLSKLPISDDEVKNIRHMIGLRRLDMEGADVTDRALKDIGEIKGLVSITLSKTLINGSGFKYIALLPNLQELQASNNDLQDSNLAALANCKRLRILKVGSARVGEQGAKYIGKIRSLEEVRLSGNSGITDHAISYLTGLVNLKTLNLRETSVTIDALASLKKLPSLKHLELSGRLFSPSQFHQMKKELPKCRIKLGNNSKVTPDLFAPLH